MSSNARSRWADTEEDAKLDAKLKREKEEKRRKKAEKARKLEAEKQAQAEAAQKHRDSLQVDDDDRPSKRRRLTPEPNGSTAKTELPPAKLLRFETGSWGKCRSVENYDKLNDIEEGTYGWVARATERATGKIVALKRLKLEPADRSGLPVTGLREIQILKDCRHRNIVTMEEVVVGDDLFRPDKYFSRLPPPDQDADFPAAQYS